MRLWTVIALFGLVVAGCEEDVREVRLLIPSIDSQLPIPDALECLENAPSDRLMITRALDRQPARASAVVDYIRLGGTPGCRNTQLLAWCRDNGCSVLEDARVCFDIDLSQVTDPQGFLTALSDLGGQLVSTEAPEEIVVVRTVMVAESCEEVAARPELAFPCDRLMGCAFSCPVDLGSFEGDVVLDLGALQNRCEPAVRVCASDQGFQADNNCLPP